MKMMFEGLMSRCVEPVIVQGLQRLRQGNA